ncbi:gluconokinase [Oricola thermophila]|uniref:Gluconokinase n=1 Tax=Oricola thermophila TaxID=2742145 RepID=A0A6N1V9W4_9HYPH|nr:gluconokinase, GntK/IdnK-type [Oricola thermophila]QKV17518.1 AAA family ATPase [Oricola thermophila]
MRAGNPNDVLVVMGVCGAGKSAVAGRLAACLRGGLIEADDFHTDEARARMSRGEPLDDALRLPWLDRIGEATLARLRQGGPVVVACSALRRLYRDRLRGFVPSALFIHLNGDRELIAQRLDRREGHFVGRSLLDSQIEALEPLAQDEAGMVLDVAVPLDTLVGTVLRELGNAETPSLNSGPVGDDVAGRQN